MGIRDRAFQPTTKDTGDLIIGLMKMSTGASEDVASESAHSGLTTLGAVSSSSLSMTPTFKEHQAGYPQILDFKIAELLQATFSAEVEEITDAIVLDIIDEAIISLETGTPIYYAVEALAEFATGGTLSLFSPYAQLKPSLNFNFGDDFNAAPLEFEALSKSDYTNNDLLYRTRVAAGARAVVNQPMTKDVGNLGIGMFQVRVGKPSRREAGTMVIEPAQKRVNGTGWDDTNTNPVATSSGDYVGALDGAYIVEITNATGPIATVTEPDGTETASVDFSTSVGTPVVLGDGVELSFDSVDVAGFEIGCVWVVGVYTPDAISNLVTGISSPYSFLTKADSVGAIQSASLETNPTYKEHYSGFPKISDLIMLESSTVTVNTAVEEVNADTALITTGYAVNLFDILFDASVNGTLYNVPVEIVANMATGGVISFWLPNCQITPQGEFSPGQEWASMQFAFESQVQGASSGIYRLYRQDLVQDV